MTRACAENWSSKDNCCYLAEVKLTRKEWSVCRYMKLSPGQEEDSRPGLSRAGSIKSGRLVAAST